ncbi:MAG TPA: biosynthetic-type acetolactate synthase large subunit [Lachnospiraceae bacterium]|nr:biosynthetic-type acetolactate synthase large subunit [Lachnospiraceae bacterium]
MLLTGSQIIIEVLKEQKVDVIFGYPGGHVLSIYDELFKNQDRIKHILTADEQGASHAADGYSRVSGEVGVVIATSGPGATNLVTGLATAFSDSIPMVAITGNVPLRLSGTDSFQEIDAMSLTVAVTKHSFFVRNVEKLADTMRDAFRIAKSGRPGPVLIDIPHDVQKELCTFETKEKQQKDENEQPPIEEMNKAVEMINQAKRPVIYCGGGVINSNSAEEIKKLAEKCDAYVVFSMMGLSAMSAEHPKYLGMAGMYGRQDASRVMAQADLVIATGVRFAERGTGDKEKFVEKAKIIHLDIDISEHGKIINADTEITGDLKTALKYLEENVEQKHNTQWSEEVEKIKQTYGEKPADKKFFRPKEIIETINKIVPKGTAVATDVGQHQMWTAKYYSFSKPRTWLTSGGFGTMGFGMGAAIGAAVATKQKTLLFTGDGSFCMNMNEVITASRNNLPVIVVILNNGNLGMIKQLQTFFYGGNCFSIDLGNKTDFVKLADAFGATGYRAKNMEDLEIVMKKALQDIGPVIIDCIISPEENTLPMMPPNGSVNNIITK